MKVMKRREVANRFFSGIQDLTDSVYLQTPFAALFTVRVNTMSHSGPNFGYAFVSIFAFTCIRTNSATVPLEPCRNSKIISIPHKLDGLHRVTNSNSFPALDHDP